MGWLRLGVLQNASPRLFVKHAGLLAPFAVQVLALSMPFVVIPYLTRTLGARAFGEFAFCQAFAAIGTAIVDYGFQISATRSLTEVRGDRTAIGRRASGVLTAKALIASLYTFAALALLPIYPAFFRTPEVMASAIALALFQGLNFYWFFAGLQRVLFASLLDLLARASAALGIVLFVHEPSQAWLAVALFAAGSAASFSLSMILAWPMASGFMFSWVDAKRSLAAGRHIFVQSVFGNIYVGATSFVLGLFVSPYYVGVFSGAEKLIRAAQLPLLPIRLVFYPGMVAAIGRSREAGRARVLRLAGVVLPVMALGSVILFAAAEPIVKIALGAKLAGAAELLRMMAFVPLLSSATDFISVFWLLSNGRDRAVTHIVVGGLASQVLVIVAGAHFWPGWAGAAAVTSSQAIALLMCLWALGRRPLSSDEARGERVFLPSRDHSANS
jgi:PST family polysaccharide transporter